MKGAKGQGVQGNGPRFNRDCNSISDANEKMKCFEEFYNNAQVQIKDDFRQREMTDQNSGEKITPEEEAQRKVCMDKGMGTILEHENGKRVVICVDKNQLGAQGGQQCQSQDQIERLKQDCKLRGQDAQVETRGGCPWVICVSQGYNTQQQMPSTISGGVNNIVNNVKFLKDVEYQKVLTKSTGHTIKKLADVDAIRTFWQTTSESFYIPNYN